MYTAKCKDIIPRAVAEGLPIFEQSLPPPLYRFAVFRVYLHQYLYRPVHCLLPSVVNPLENLERRCVGYRYCCCLREELFEKLIKILRKKCACMGVYYYYI